jgi:Na+-translocating ferredoxin:NAD+ oxidoreductase subunit C
VLKTFAKGGTHPPENKLTSGKAIEKLPLDGSVIIPLAQHLGSPAVPVVNKGDKVLAGQIIAKATGFISANIHSSVSGIINKIDTVSDSSGFKTTSVVIDVSGDEWIDTIDRTSTVENELPYSSEEIIEKCFQSGIVGMGGASFPTHVKLNVPAGKKCTLLVINGVECEPYLTSDHRLMLERGEEIMAGIRLMMKALKVDRAVIGIENNKPDAISNLTNLCNGSGEITVQPLKVKYPQGGEKQLIKAITGREVPSGGLPIDIGIMVQNVATAFAIYEAVIKNKPLFERVVTITGAGLKNPGNYLVRIGTPVSSLIEAAGGLPADTGKIINGGPMMGKAIGSTSVAVVKGTSGIVVLPSTESVRKEPDPCIRCGKCLSACALCLEPMLLAVLSEKGMFERAEQEKITDCCECGSCSYICPASRPLLDYIRLGKTNVNRMIRERKIKQS